MNPTRRPSSSPAAHPPAAEALRALREREVPEGILEGFYASVRERLPYAPAGGGMSLAFLSAPRTLRLWRGAAIAAALLLGVGAGLVTTGTLAPAGSPVVVREGIEQPLDFDHSRDVVLEPYAARRSTGVSTISFPRWFFTRPSPAVPEPKVRPGARED